MTSTNSFIDNGDNTFTDPKTELTWTAQDTWLAEQRWVTWDEALDFTNKLNVNKFAGHMDWRLPSVQEAITLYQPDAVNTDKYGKEVHIDAQFPEGCLPTIWCDEPGGGTDGATLNLATGEVGTLYKSKCPRMAARGVRGERWEP